MGKPAVSNQMWLSGDVKIRMNDILERLNVEKDSLIKTMPTALNMAVMINKIVLESFVYFNLIASINR